MKTWKIWSAWQTIKFQLCSWQLMEVNTSVTFIRDRKCFFLNNFWTAISSHRQFEKTKTMETVSRTKYIPACFITTDIKMGVRFNRTSIVRSEKSSANYNWLLNIKCASFFDNEYFSLHHFNIIYSYNNLSTGFVCICHYFQFSVCI